MCSVCHTGLICQIRLFCPICPDLPRFARYLAIARCAPDIWQVPESPACTSPILTRNLAFVRSAGLPTRSLDPGIASSPTRPSQSCRSAKHPACLASTSLAPACSARSCQLPAHKSRRTTARRRRRRACVACPALFALLAKIIAFRAQASAAQRSAERRPSGKHAGATQGNAGSSVEAP